MKMTTGAMMMLLLGACSDSSTSMNMGPMPFVVQPNTADGKSAFVGTVADIKSGIVQKNTNSFEVTAFSYTYVHKRQVVTLQGANADVVFFFNVKQDGLLEQVGTYNVDPNSYAASVLWVNDDRMFMSLANGGKILDMNPNTRTVNKTIDLNAAKYTVGFEDAMDINPNPTSMLIRDGKLYVTLWQTKATFVPRDGGAAMAIIDLATNTVEKYIVDKRGLSGAGRPGETDSMFLDENNDIYVYCGGGFGGNPMQHHGFLRIKSGATDFDPNYFYDLSTVQIDGLPGKTSDFINSLHYYKNGKLYVELEDPSLFGNPPDYVNTYNYGMGVIDVYAKTTKLIGLPLANGMCGPMSIDIIGDTLYTALGTKSHGIGLFSYDIPTGVGSPDAIVPTDGFVGTLRKVRE